ncbi:MAG: hypothetical protein RLY86_2169 [Pseudomonadota bacterium]|jgi:aminoglycoside/choline kinase family phosphotransferase
MSAAATVTGADPAREILIRGFLAQAGWEGAARVRIAADWSTRRYERLSLNGRTAILMDADAPWTEQVAPYVRLCAVLRSLDLSAPEVFAADTVNGFALSEDLGSTLVADRLDRGDDPVPLYTDATDVLIHLRRRFDPATDLPRRHDAARFRAEVALYGTRGVPGITGRPLDAAAAADLDAAWAAVLEPALAMPWTLMLRDYFPGNIMDLPDRAGVARCGLLDVQDGGHGPVAYDLLSLLEDARRDVGDDLKSAMIARYLDAFPDLDRGQFLTGFAVLGAVRHARILGRLAEIVTADPKARQRAFLPRVYRQFMAKLREPALAPVAERVHTHVPSDGFARLLQG